jgi:competence protein ComEA
MSLLHTLEGRLGRGATLNLCPVSAERSGFHHVCSSRVTNAFERNLVRLMWIEIDVRRFELTQPERPPVSDTAAINVNEATAEELDAIPALKGHGFEIVRYRGERGRFTDLRQLDEVPGLTGKADDGRAALTVGDA